MAHSINAILDGFDYQALWFWFYVCDMLSHEAEVDRVGFEVEEYSAFDDVAIAYRSPVNDGAGNKITGKFYSIKHSVSYEKEISVDVLDDPAFINASTRSLLQKLQEAVSTMGKSKSDHLFVLAAPWGMKSDDPIRKLVNTQFGNLLLDRLFDGTGKKGQMGAIRARWMKHLELDDELELRRILSYLRIEQRSQPQEVHLEELALRLNSVNIRRVQKNDMAASHFRIPFELRKQGKLWHTREEICEVCRSQKLFLDAFKQQRNATQIAVRSFLPFADGLGQKVDHMLCVAEEFAGRAPKSAKVWTEIVPARVQNFLSDVVKQGAQYDLHLHCFGSMAFYAGHLLEPGLGISAGIAQRTYGKPEEIWTLDEENARKADEPWSLDVHKIGDGAETAVAVSITTVTLPKVQEHCLSTIPGVGRIVHVTPIAGPSHNSVKSGTDAFVLASRLKNHLASLPNRSGPLHLFWSGPNAFAFYFGQLARMLGKCIVYEFDSDSQSYSPAIQTSSTARIAIKN